MNNQRVPRADFVNWTRQLVTMLNSGIPLYRSLVLLTQETKHDTLKSVLGNVTEKVRQGTPFSTALESHQSIFQPMFINVVRAGEESGKLDFVLEKFADFLDKQYGARKQIQSLLIYPSLLMTMAILSILFILLVVIPKFGEIFAQLEQQLPFTTKLLLKGSNLIRTNWFSVLVGVVCIVLITFFLLKTKFGKEIWAKIRINLPILGSLVNQMDLSRFALLLGTLVGSGVPMLRALETAKYTMTNPILVKDTEYIIQQVKHGGSVSEAMRYCKMFPTLFIQMMVVGEETGKVDSLLMKAHEFYEREIEHSIKSLLSVLEPLLIVAMGIVVGTMVISILLPLLSVSTSGTFR
jgi:type II secretory pathway component PulF